MGHLGRKGSNDRGRVASLKQEQLERRSTPFGSPMHVPGDPPPPSGPELPPDDGGGAGDKRTASPPCYRVNVRVLRNL
jgi:hypothetical protein